MKILRLMKKEHSLTPYKVEKKTLWRWTDELAGRWRALIVFGDSTMVVVYVLGYALQLQRFSMEIGGIRDSSSSVLSFFYDYHRLPLGINNNKK